MRCLDVPEVTNHKDRLLYPMKRDPKDRGKDKWKRITWDEAYDLITEKFMDMKEKYGAESVVFAQGTGRDIAAYITRLCWSFGSPNYTGFLSGQACYLPRIAGMAATTGAPWIPDAAQQFPERYDHPDYEVPEVMFIWGDYPLKSNIEGFYGHWVIDLMKRGMKIVTVDPKVTWLATKSELHLRVRPGTDAALALGMINIIIKEDLYDHDFVDRWCYGFDELAERAAEFPVERVSEITWVPEDKIIAVARMLGNAKNSTLQWGVAVDMTREAMPAGQAILALWEITGNMERPSGMIVAPEILSVAGGWGREVLGPIQEDKRIGIHDYPLYNFGFAVSQPDETVKTIETGEPYEIHGAWLQTTNPLACMGADPQRLYKALNKLDFIVVVDLFKTPTIAALADVVLPAQTFCERNGIAFVSGTYEKGMLRPDGQPGFNTPTGRIELWSNFYSRAGLDPLPYFEEPEPGPGSTPDLMDEYPLVMTSGALLGHVPLRASPDRAHALLPSVAADGDPSRHRRQVRHQGRRLGVDGGPDGPRQAQGQAHAADGPPHGVVRSRLVVPRGRSREVLRRVRPQHQQHAAVDSRQERLRLQLQELHLQDLQGSGGGIDDGEVRFAC